ncbi:hypothetical protein BOX15_Mlig007899g3 [Macrostomum lignano]|uniref:Uncharacterized protein n=2 Tax=Macrostomum lignano TaxID=282301 RepID=A0A267HB07_9PLAT|nr:hypothetical protein BOX15_Mlig007899g3 [Macrostomum lignano]
MQMSGTSPRSPAPAPSSPLGRQHQQLYDRARHRSPWKSGFRRRCLEEMRRRRSDFLMRVRQADEDGAAAASDDYDVRGELEQLLDAEIGGGGGGFEWMDSDELLEIEAAMRRELSQCGCVCPACRCGQLRILSTAAGRRLVCDCGLLVRLPASCCGDGIGSDPGLTLGDLRESLLDCASAHASLCTEDTAVLVVDDGQGGDSLIVSCDHCQFCCALI